MYVNLVYTTLMLINKSYEQPSDFTNQTYKVPKIEKAFTVEGQCRFKNTT